MLPSFGICEYLREVTRVIFPLYHKKKYGSEYSVLASGILRVLFRRRIRCIFRSKKRYTMRLRSRNIGVVTSIIDILEKSLNVTERTKRITFLYDCYNLQAHAFHNTEIYNCG